MDEQLELETWLKLVHARAPCLRELDRMVRRCWPDRSFLTLPGAELAAFASDLAARLPGPDPAALETDIAWLERSPRHRLVAITSAEYPWLLREIPDPPLALYVSGDTACLNRPALAIVGSRNPTPQGREIAAAFARQLADAGFLVVSGLAQGIDGAAHRGALERGSTIAVCATGLDTVYPRDNRSLAAEISSVSALVSEFPTGTGPMRHHFPQRNRIISGMSRGTLVVEAGIRSGSLITANHAAEQNREVFAVPGSIFSPVSRGCHDLIRKGVTLVESLDDILGEVRQYSDAPVSGGVDCRPDAAHSRFLEHMGWGACTPDELVRRSGLTSAEVSSMLLALELEGCVELCPGGKYVRVSGS